MKKTNIYIIPGWGENCGEARYKKLAKTLEIKGYEVSRVNPDWYKSLSENVFKPKANSVLIGFSYGAVIAYLIAKKYSVEKVVFCSLSPIEDFPYEEIYSDYLKHMDVDLSEKNAKDIKKIKISLKTLNVPYITFAGDKEKDIKANIVVPNTGHFLSSNYIKYIESLF